MNNLTNNLWINLKFALRQLRRSPGFAFTAVLTLALGVGVNTAVFSFLDQALLRSLPVSKPSELVVLEGTGKRWEGHSSSHGGDLEAYFSYPMYRDLRDRNAAFSALLATSPADMQVSWHNNAEEVTGEIVSGNYFSLLGVNAARGRMFTQADDSAPGANAVAVLAHDFWQNHLGADPAIVGQNITVNGQPFQVVGIAAPGFHSAVWGETPSLFVPMSMIATVIPGEGKRLTNHRDRWMNIIGRLRTGETAAQAQAAMAPLWHALRADELKALGSMPPAFVKDFLTESRMLVVPAARGFSYSRADLQTPLLVAMGMALLVLLIAAVNVASLLLVRSAGRVREFSVRAALGARSGQIVSQLLLEGLLIGLLGGLAGLLLAPVVLRALIHQLAHDDGSSAFSSTLDSRVLLFNFAVALGVSLCFSLAPVLQLRRPNLTATLRGNSATAAGGLLSLRRVIVSLQIGLSVLLLVGSGLFVRTMHNLRSLDLGFRVQHLVTFGVTPRLAGYTPEQAKAVQQRAIDALAATPGIAQAGAIDSPQLSDSTHGGNITIAGYVPRAEEEVDVNKADINPAFFSAMQVRLMAGRNFSEGDDATHPLVTIVNEAMAKHYFGSAQAALGHRLADGGGDKVVYDTEIVGVVHDFKQQGIRSDVAPTLFRPLRQLSVKQPLRELHFYLQTQLPPADAFASVRRTMQQVDRALALDTMRTMEQQVDDNLQDDRMVELLAVTFGALATALAGIGLYGVLAYTTAQRTREIGIRMALGSSRAAISQLILNDVLKLAVIGLACGLPVAYGLAGLLRSQLFGISTADPLVLASVVGLIAVIAMMAALLPVRRAVSVDPNDALRTE